MWKKQDSGAWKIAIDIGTGHAESPKPKAVATPKIKSRPQTTLAKQAGQELVKNYGFKKLPVSEPWPGGRDMRDVLRRYGLTENAPADAIPVPARITGLDEPLRRLLKVRAAVNAAGKQ